MPHQQPQLNTDELAADLGWATTLLEQALPKSAPELPTEPSPTPESEETLDLGEDTHKEEMDAKMDTFKEEVKSMIKDELSEIKETIKEALKDSEKPNA